MKIQQIFKRSEFWLMFAIAAIMLFAFAPFSFATGESVLLSNTDMGAYADQTVTVAGDTGAVRYCQTFTALSTASTTAIQLMKHANVTNDMTVLLRLRATNCTGTVLATSTSVAVTGSSAGTSTYSFPIVASLADGSVYAIELDTTSTSTDYVNFVGSYLTSLADGQGYYTTDNGSNWNDAGSGGAYPSDMWFRILGFQRSIEFRNYATGINIYDFPTWRVALEDDSAVSGRIYVGYSRFSSSTDEIGYNSTSTTSVFDRYDFYLKPTGSVNYEVSKSRPLWFPPLRSPVTWYAQAHYTDTNGTLVASSQVMTLSIAAPFVIDLDTASSSSSFYCNEPASVWSSSTLPYAACIMKSGFMDILSWIFLPQESLVDTIDPYFQSLKETFPFSVVYGYTEGLRDAADAASSTTSTLSLAISADGEPYSFTATLLSPTTLEDVAGTSTAALIFEAERMVIWLGAALTMISFIIL